MATTDIYFRPREYCFAKIVSKGEDSIQADLVDVDGEVSRASFLISYVADRVPLRIGVEFGVLFYDLNRYRAKIIPLKSN